MFLFLDLDGPVLNVSERYHRLHSDLAAELGFPSMDRNTYWNSKRHRIPEKAILEMLGAGHHYEFYRQKRLHHIESPKYLELDALQPNALAALEELGRDHTIVIVTLRQNRQGLESELDRMLISKLVAQVLSHNQTDVPGWKIKSNLISHFLATCNKKAGRMIGDTETDILAAQALGFESIAVTCGIRDLTILEKYRPDSVVEDLSHLTRLL